MSLTHLLPEGWKKPHGYSNGIVAEGKLVVLGGQIGWNAEQVFEAHNFTDQLRQTLENILALLSEAGARPEDLIRLTWFITDKHEYLASLRQVGVIYREVFGKNYPAMSVVQVVSLMEDQAKLEIEATAVIKTSSS